MTAVLSYEFCIVNNGIHGEGGEYGVIDEVVWKWNMMMHKPTPKWLWKFE